MKATTREKFHVRAARAVAAFAIRRRGIVTRVLAVLMVAGIVPLVMARYLPFPRPGEQILYNPEGWPGEWAMLFERDDNPSPRPWTDSEGPQSFQGGESYAPAPLTMMTYKVKPGDTLMGISERLGMDPDTLSSVNRPEGRGVHTLIVGEEIKVPNQDGIYLAVNGDLDDVCRKHNSEPELVLAANRISRADLAPGMKLFFPGVQHTGWEYSQSVGLSVFNPLRGGWLSSPFGRREDPFTGSPSYHRGIDIAASQGSPIRSASDGRVIVAASDDVLGNYVVVRAPSGDTFVYGHMEESLVHAGAHVAQGSVLGRVGSTGHATGPHLHFEVHDKHGVLLNPRRLMPGVR